ncbi:MAG TPA: ABATE domain-containing protein [Planctomycetota bacterium]|nr:ABATE domain-containing protein [Planctomycetota bacterium]
MASKQPAANRAARAARAARTAATASGPPYFLADHLALDFLNTRAVLQGAVEDWLADDNRVIDWLQRAGLHARGSRGAPAAEGELVRAAVELREALRALVAARQRGARASPAVLNRFLANGTAHRRLDWPVGGEPLFVEVRGVDTPEDLLLPVATLGAELLAQGNFGLVRECAGPDCVLWFYDRTKSHRRQWCSMRACGNRAKLAAFRARQRS